MKITCIVCPNGCQMLVERNKKEVTKVGYALCPKGKKYAHDEIFNPIRTLTTTIKVENGVLPLVSVRSDRPIPKKALKKAVRALGKLILAAPIRFHQVVADNFLETGAKIITTREIALSQPNKDSTFSQN